MLLSENGGGCQDRGLRSVRSNDRGCEYSQHRFSRSDITLQQAVHGFACIQVRAQLGESALLRLGEFERQAGCSLCNPIVILRKTARLRLLPVPLLTQDT